MEHTYVGEIRIFAGNFPPAGWELCNGQEMAISENDSLFNLIGTTYGGDGELSFRLPNLQGRSPVHKTRNNQLGETGLIGWKDWASSQSQKPETPAPGYLALNFIISLFGFYPSPDSGGGAEPFLGEGRLFAFDFAPSGWASCNGQLLRINQNQALFSLLGTTYGGNGQTTFALPDLRGAIPIHTDPLVLGESVNAVSPEPSTEPSSGFLILNYCIALQGIFPQYG
ncbi:MAG: hypothetical protein QOD75_3938 [Blastocatellia bacterium]|jgi:microcystin-dependent protein|nr:hypothetical protein [Blastocatellia bacterium]